MSGDTPAIPLLLAMAFTPLAASSKPEKNADNVRQPVVPRGLSFDFSRPDFAKDAGRREQADEGFPLVVAAGGGRARAAAASARRQRRRR